MRLSLALAAALALPGCFPAPDVGHYCERDSDCDGECARGGRCIEAGSGVELRLSWTIAGAEATDETCAGIEALEVRLTGDGDELGYYPVPCELGQVYFDRLAPWLDTVELIAVDPLGYAVARARDELGGSAEIRVDLAP